VRITSEDVLDDVGSQQAIERIACEGIGEAVQVAENVGRARWVAVDADRPLSLPDSAADVEDAHSRYLNHRAAGHAQESYCFVSSGCFAFS